MTCAYISNRHGLKETKSRMAKSRLHIANRMPKSLSMDYSNNLENLRPKIM